MSLIYLFRFPFRDTHDGGDGTGGGGAKKDYFVWSEADYRRRVLGIPDALPSEDPKPEPQEEETGASLPDQPVWSPPVALGPTQGEIEQTLLAIQGLSDELKAAKAKAAYLSHVAVLLEAFAIREQAMQAEELALLMMLEN